MRSSARPERCEVRLLARLDPHLVRLGGRLGELDRELGGHAARAVPVALRDPDEGGVVGVVRKRARIRLELLEQLAESLVDDVCVDDLLERPELRRSCRRPAGRHEHRHVPDEDCLGAAEVRELAEAFLELGEGCSMAPDSTVVRTAARRPAGTPFRPRRRFAP